MKSARRVLELLQPKRLTLLDGLVEVYGDRSEARGETQRELATTILRQFAVDQPAHLAELLLTGDSAQFNALFPIAAHDRNAAAVARLLRQELQRRVAPRWDDLAHDPAWTAPDQAAVAAIEAARGMLRLEFAFCQTMPRAEFDRVVEMLRPAGYRPTRVRPFPVGDGLLVAAVWKRDGRDWELAWDVTPDSPVAPTASAPRPAMQPVEVAGYLHMSGSAATERFLVLGAETAGQDERHATLAGSSKQQLLQTAKAMAKEGFPAIDTLQAYVGADGTRKYCAIFSSSGAART